jgi:thermitase
MRLKIGLLLILFSQSISASDYLVKFKDRESLNEFIQFNKLSDPHQKNVEMVQFAPWALVKNIDKKNQNGLKLLKSLKGVEIVQPNYRTFLIEDYSQANGQALKFEKDDTSVISDNLPIPPSAPTRDGQAGLDPQVKNQWGMNLIGAKNLWAQGQTGSSQMVVAVIDTGIDYTHEDLVTNLWRNPNEIPGNGIDDDKNGYVDDEIGWDFVTNDNKPFDLSVSVIDLITKGGNPGHGTHCAGNVAARFNNAKGISGVAPNVKIMGLRFLSEKGEGTTFGAIKAVEYAVNQGVKVLSNSWGSEGEDPNDGPGNQALKDVINYAQSKGAIFVAAAGNGHQGGGYDNDTDPKPAYPASYDMDTIISVAALNDKDHLGSFSNWGARSVDLGAPGVKVYSTVPGNKYQDTIFDMFGMKVTWDGTSMATPHVAGAIALYWSQYPEKTWSEVKEIILDNTVAVESLKGKSVSGGKLDLKFMLR